MLEFRADDHAYHWDGVRVPSVTQVLAPLFDFSSVSRAALEAAAALGKAVHLATQLDDTADLNEASVDPLVMPYLDAWRQFRHDTGAAMIEIESPIYSKRYGFAGTPDRVALLNDDIVLLDIKTSAAMHPAFGPQLAAYTEMFNELRSVRYGKIAKRYAVALRGDGTYALKPYTDRNDMSVFLAALALWRFREKHGLLNGEAR